MEDDRIPPRGSTSRSLKEGDTTVEFGAGIAVGASSIIFDQAVPDRLSCPRDPDNQQPEIIL